MNRRIGWGCGACAVGLVNLASLPALRAEDCNGNGATDSLDISRGTSLDCNANAIPDECDLSGVRFAPVSYYPVPGGSLVVRAADLDRDSHIDLVVAGGDQNVSVFWNDGSGLLGTPVNYIVPNSPGSLALADLTGDLFPEIVVGCTGGGLSILPNNGDRTFGARIPYDINRTRDVAAADLDGDRDLDLVILTWNYGWEVAKVRVWVNSGTGGFPTPVSYNVGQAIASIVAADLDGDEDIDIAVADGKAAFSCIHILLNNGDATFQAPIDRNVGAVPTFLAGADFDGDADVDLVFAKGSYTLATILNNGDATFADTPDRGMSGTLYWIEPIDLDRDGDVDIVTPYGNLGSISFLLNRGNAVFGPAMHASIELAGQGKGPRGIEAADLDGDLWPDLATADSETPDAAVLLNRSVPPLSRDADRSGVPDECECVKGADWDGDTDVDSDDLAAFVACAAGPLILVPAECASKDLDCDGDIDQVDFARFQRLLHP